jgi:hypothetical protein
MAVALAEQELRQSETLARRSQARATKLFGKIF